MAMTIRMCCTTEKESLLLSFPNHADNRSTHHVISQLGEERLLDKVAVVGVEELLGGLLGLHGGQSVSLGFESVDNVSDDSTLNTIGLDHDVGALRGVHGHGESVGKSQKGKDTSSVEGVHLDGVCV